MGMVEGEARQQLWGTVLDTHRVRKAACCSKHTLLTVPQPTSRPLPRPLPAPRSIGSSRACRTS